MVVKTTEIGKTDKWISYGFKEKERIGISNGEIREIIMNAHKIFKLLAKDYAKMREFILNILEQHPELQSYKKSFENRKSEFEIVLENDKKLDKILEKWIVWGMEREKLEE